MIGEIIRMIKFLKSKKLYSKIFIGIMLLYFVCVFSSQQTKLNSYKNEKKYYEEQINELTEEQENLQSTLKNVNSSEYIEKIAREKLGMYYPYESVFIDISK